MNLDTKSFQNNDHRHVYTDLIQTGQYCTVLELKIYFQEKIRQNNAWYIIMYQEIFDLICSITIVLYSSIWVYGLSPLYSNICEYQLKFRTCNVKFLNEDYIGKSGAFKWTISCWTTASKWTIKISTKKVHNLFISH